MTHNPWLLLGAGLRAIAGFLHLGIIVKGAAWYRFFGAGERFAQAAERGERWQDVVTFGIATVLFVWVIYALSGAGAIAKMPLLKWALVAITGVYLLRGFAIFPLAVAMPKSVTPFLIWSSTICLLYGIVHLVGLVQVWQRLR